MSADTTQSTGLKVFGALGGTGGELLRHHARDPYRPLATYKIT